MLFTKDIYNMVTQGSPKSYENWGTGIILQNPATDKILLARRVDNKMYGTPGGRVELGESPYKGVIRECKEESNIDILDMKFFGIDYHTSPTNVKWVSFCFYSDYFDEENIKNQKSEMEEWGYYSVEEALKLELFPPTRQALTLAIELGVLQGAENFEGIPFVNCPKSASEVSVGVPCQYSISEQQSDTYGYLKSPWYVWD